MNLDDFEKKMQDQPLREIPASWRSQILHAAAPTQKTAWWRELLWPCPQAWAGLAAVWLVILGLNVIATGNSSQSPENQRVALSHEDLRDLKKYQLALAGLIEPAETSEDPPSPALSPRSERRKTSFNA